MFVVADDIGMGFEGVDGALLGRRCVGSVDRAIEVAGVGFEIGELGPDDKIVMRTGGYQRGILRLTQTGVLAPLKSNHSLDAGHVAIFVQLRGGCKTRLHQCGRGRDLTTHGALPKMNFGKGGGNEQNRRDG